MKDYFKSALVYYYKKLSGDGNPDPVRVIISDFLETVKVTDEQKKFILANTENDKRTLDNIISIISASDNIETDQSLKTAKAGLEYLRDKN